jgi:hypothetical protein
MKRHMIYGAIILLLAVVVGLAFMVGTRPLAEPAMEALLRTAHTHYRAPLLPSSSIRLLSSCAGIAGFLLVIGKSIEAATPRRRPRTRH